MRRVAPLVALSLLGLAGSAVAASTAVASGRELFLRTWLPWDTRTQAGGDGLGPMYNASSCASCHNQGGIGGAGGRERNVRLVRPSGSQTFVVDHRFTTLSPRPLGATSGTRAERNTPALFGAGAIDGIPDKALFELAAGQTGDLSGRVAKASDGKVGRFGWKGHTSSLTEFVSTACANELGLAVEGHKQGAPPPGDLAERLALMESAMKANGLSKDLLGGGTPDLNAKEVSALVGFVSALPQPVELNSQPNRGTGLALFKSAGCDGCHVQDVAGVKGLYADLLLHDMGASLGDGAGTYETRGNQRPIAEADPKAPASAAEAAAAPAEPPSVATTTFSADANEWRTPPLWGTRDSGPWMHDGRAATLDEAVRLHGGEGSVSAAKYTSMPMTDQQLVIAFLESLAAPTGG